MWDHLLDTLTRARVAMHRKLYAHQQSLVTAQQNDRDEATDKLSALEHWIETERSN